MDDDMRDKLRNERDELIREAKERQDQWRQENRDKHDRLKDLHGDLEDAYTSYNRAKRDQNALDMIKAFQRIDEVKKQIEAMNNN